MVVVTTRATAGRRPRAGRTSVARARWRVTLALAMLTLGAVLAALEVEGFTLEARLLHVLGWSLLALLGLSDGARRFRGGASALGDGRGVLDRGLGLVQAAVCVAMLLGFLPLPR